MRYRDILCATTTIQAWCMTKSRVLKPLVVFVWAEDRRKGPIFGFRGS